jgi:hypothetical protein
MKTKKNQVEVVEVLVNVLGVTIKAKFEKSEDRYFADISKEQLELCYTRALKLLSLWKWQSDIHIEVGGACLGGERELCFWCFREVEGNLVKISLNILEYYSSSCELVFSVGPICNVKNLFLKDFLSEQNELTMFSFSELDRKFLLTEENNEVMKKLTSEGLLVKQGEFLVFGGKGEKQEVINETSI